MNNVEEKFTVPAATLAEKPSEYVLKIELPGIGKEDAELHLDGKTLTLRTHGKYQNPAGFKQVVGEFAHDNYAMSVDLPDMADLATMKAKLENGIVIVTLQKRAESKATKIAIE